VDKFIKLTGYVEQMIETERAYAFLVGKPFGNWPLETLRSTQIKMDHREMDFAVEKLI
jgi:hypothetical protein